MKNIFYICLALGFMFSSVTFVSCGSDDGGNNNPENGGSAQNGTSMESMLIGVWEGPVHVKGRNVHPDGRIEIVDEDVPANEIERVEFKADHTYSFFALLNGSYVANSPGTWKLEGNKITVTDAHETKVLTIVSLNESILIYTSDVVDYNIDGAYMEFTLRKISGGSDSSDSEQPQKAADRDEAGNIKISETNFPDEKFRNWLLNQDYGNDGLLTSEELSKRYFSMDVSSKGIQSLKGIEFFTSLETFNCSDNQLTSLDVSKNTALKYLYCSKNQLTSIDVFNNSLLAQLDCYDNQLTSLDVSKNLKLAVLSCNGNQLTSLDVSKNPKLLSLFCYDNQLTSLDVSKYTNTKLSYIECYRNQIKGDAMDKLVESLPTKSDCKMYVIYFGNDQNEMTTTQVATAKTKGWQPYYTDGKLNWKGYVTWKEYAGVDPAAK